MRNDRGKIKREGNNKVVSFFDTNQVLHNENIEVAKRLCVEMEQRDKEMGKIYTIPLKKGVKVVTKNKYLEYLKSNNN